MTAIANAAQTLSASIEAISALCHWVVWSEADQDAGSVFDGWIDNAFDTQRRRGVQASSRTTWVA
jgi:hypothetical protein